MIIFNGQDRAFLADRLLGSLDGDVLNDVDNRG